MEFRSFLNLLLSALLLAIPFGGKITRAVKPHLNRVAVASGVLAGASQSKAKTERSNNNDLAFSVGAGVLTETVLDEINKAAPKIEESSKMLIHVGTGKAPIIPYTSSLAPYLNFCNELGGVAPSGWTGELHSFSDRIIFHHNFKAYTTLGNKPGLLCLSH